VASAVAVSTGSSGAPVAGATLPPRGTASAGSADELFAETFGAAIERATADHFRASIAALSVELRRGADSLRIGPSRFALGRDERRLSVDVSPNGGGAGAGTPLTLHVNAPLPSGELELDLSGGPVRLSTLGVREGDFGLQGVHDARIEADAHVKLGGSAGRVVIASKGSLENLRLLRPALAPHELSGIRLGWRFDGDVNADLSSVHIQSAEVSLGNVRLELGGDASARAGELKLAIVAEVPLASCSDLLAAMPRGMVPLLEGVRMEGTFAAKAKVNYDRLHPEAADVVLEVNNQCRIAEFTPAISPARFRRLWVREVKGADGLPMEIESGPGSPDWVPYEDISPYLETSIIVCEDAGFFGHHGFDYKALESATRQNLQVGRFLRGASTVSMQLAKNLYLGKEKTLSRKIQEAVLTLLLEQEMSKHELMELYLNVIEFGPGIYGVRQAARYYFNEEPRDLSLGQALYLASILPSPDTQHFLPDGRVSDRWSGYLKKLMRIAYKIRRISDDELATALAEQVAFRKPNLLGPEAPFDSNDAGMDDEAPFAP
jgi:hypothetical protein